MEKVDLLETKINKFLRQSKDRIRVHLVNPRIFYIHKEIWLAVCLYGYGMTFKIFFEILVVEFLQNHLSEFFHNGGFYA